MKRLSIFLLILVTVPALGQTSDQTFGFDPLAIRSLPISSVPTQSNCEVTILSASFERPARMMLTGKTESAQAAPTLRLQLENNSAKPIQSLDLMARIKFKDSVYQLDSITRDLPLHLTRGEGWQRLQLAESALGFAGLSIQQVNFADGSFWKPANTRACSYPYNGGTERVAK